MCVIFVIAVYSVLAGFVPAFTLHKAIMNAIVNRQMSISLMVMSKFELS